MITIKLFKIHDAQIILDSDNNKFLIYFVRNNNNNNNNNMCNVYLDEKIVSLTPTLLFLTQPSIGNSTIPKVSAFYKPGKHDVKLAVT